MRIVSTLALWFITALEWAFAQPPAPPGQTEFVPVSSLPPQDQLPAAPLLIAAYAFVWVALFIYLWSIWRRLQRVEQELAMLESRREPGIRVGDASKPQR